MIAVSTEAKAVIIRTTKSGSIRFSSSRTSIPPISGSITSTIAASYPPLRARARPCGPPSEHGDGVARFREQALEHVSHDFLVVDDEDGFLAHSHLWAASVRTCAGRATWNVVPLPGALSTKMAPPCSCTMP